MLDSTQPLQNKRSPLSKIRFRRAAAAAIVLLIAVFGARLYMHLTDDFRLGNITYEMPYQKEWTFPPLSAAEEEELSLILQQPFTYLGKGSQCYVFASSDERYVIKFFKFKHVRPSWTDQLLYHLGFRKSAQKQAARKARKLWGLFHACKLAYDENRKESGLKYVQLNRLGNPSRQVQLIDKIGLKHQIALAELPFIIQEKAVPLETLLHRLLQAGDVAAAEQHLEKVFDFYASEYSRGLLDRDHHVLRNLGFIQKRVVHLDVGKLAKEEKMKQKEYAQDDAKKVAYALNSWISRHYPQHTQHLANYIDYKSKL
jgi:hypothetical protein